LDQITHAMIWSMLANIGGYVGVSLAASPSVDEHRQASLFVDVFRQGGEGSGARFWRGTASVPELHSVLARFLGAAAADEALQVVVYSHRLEQKSRELEAATAELRAANERLKELDRLKDDFVSTVTHELRTPLTSIRAFTQILLEHPEVDAEQRSKFLGIITKETERLTRLINQVLDLSKIESGKAEWRESMLDLRELIGDAVTGMSQVFEERDIRIDVEVPEKAAPVRADVDRIIQVMLNL